MQILLATGNRHKIDEITAILKDVPVTLKNLWDFPPAEAPEENGATYHENALIKALYYHRLTGLPTLSDDSGIEIDAFDGAPGIMSARFIDASLTYEARNRKVLEMMAGIPDEKRKARFRCCCVFAADENNIFTEWGTLEGYIAQNADGIHGFGYDPIFYLPERNMHLAQVEPDEKNRISHRGRAFMKMASRLVSATL